MDAVNMEPRASTGAREDQDWHWDEFLVRIQVVLDEKGSAKKRTQVRKPDGWHTGLEKATRFQG